MLLASLRHGILLATLVASLHVAAAHRAWTLTDVRIGAPMGPVAGYFTYDDVTNTVLNWNVRVEGGWVGGFFPDFTYVPGNSRASSARLLSGGHGIILASEFVASAFDADAPPMYFVPVTVKRALSIHTLTPLNGSSPVSLEPTKSVESLSINGIGNLPRSIKTGSLTLTPVPPPVVIAQVDEFYNPALGHYFITADAAEKLTLDTDVHAGWLRTGESFKAYAKGSSTGGSVSPVCRFYSPPPTDQ